MARRGSRLGQFRSELESFKSNEKAEAVLLLAQDSQLIRILLAWERIPIQRDKRLSEMPDGANGQGRWQWLWDNVTYSIDDLAALSGLSAEQVEKHMAVLRGNGLVHPDGTTNKYAAQYLKTKVLALFRTRGRGSSAAEKVAGTAKT